jgi:hypothetical protein
MPVTEHAVNLSRREGIHAPIFGVVHEIINRIDTIVLGRGRSTRALEVALIVALFLFRDATVTASRTAQGGRGLRIGVVNKVVGFPTAALYRKEQKARVSLGCKLAAFPDCRGVTCLKGVIETQPMANFGGKAKIRNMNSEFSKRNKKSADTRIDRAYLRERQCRPRCRERPDHRACSRQG